MTLVGETTPVDSITTFAEGIDDTLSNEVQAGTARYLNRAQRRALMKKTSKKSRQQTDLINETAKKLAYVDLIQKLREMNKEKENDNYETTD